MHRITEAVRDLVRVAVDSQAIAVSETGDCVANLSYVYAHHARMLVTRLLDVMPANHALIASTTHVHLDHDNCLESVMLRGPVSDVRARAERVRAERGVRLGRLI